MNRIIPLMIILLFWSWIQGFAQDEKGFVIPDSLYSIDYEILRTNFYKEKNKNNKLARLYALTYLQKSKKDKNLLEKAKGYSYVAYTYDNKYYKKLSYLDSAIVASKGLNHNKYPLLFYINKGVTHDNNGNFKEALDVYIYTIELAKKLNNQLFVVISNHNIALIKRKLGKYEEAKTIFNKCLIYEYSNLEKEEDSLTYLVTLSELVNAYRLNNQIDSAYIYNNQGINMSKGTLSENLFQLNNAILSYHKNEYRKAINGIKIAMPDKSKLSFLFEDYDLISALLYLGKSYEKLSEKEEAIHYYKKIDSIAKTSNYILPEARSAYLGLINHYKSLGDKNRQLFYINRLLHSDSILNNNYKYLSDKLNKDYDTPELLLQKEELIASLEAKQNSSAINMIVLLLVLAIGTVFFIISYRKQKLYQQRFEELFSSQDTLQEIKSHPVTKEGPKTIGISEDIVNSILKDLEKFEKNQEYTVANITTSSLASQFKTNSKYLSKVINTYKGKSFIHYVNDLRIEYIIQELKNNAKYRMYTIKALAAEAGFNTTEAFSKSFYKKTRIYPSYFIKQLEKQQENPKS